MFPILLSIFTIACMWPLLRNFNFLSSYNIFLGSFFLYYFLAFVDYLRGDFTLRYVTGEVVVMYREKELIFEFMLLILFVAGMLLAKLVVKNNLSRNSLKGLAFTPPAYKHVLLVSYSLMIAGCILYLCFIQAAYGGFVNMLHVDRFALYQKKRGLGSLLIGLYISYAGAIIRLFYYILYRKTVQQKFPFAASALALLLLFIQYRNGDRSNMVFSLLPLCLIALYRKPRLNFYLALILPAALLVMQVIAVQRKLPKDVPVIDFVLHNRQSINLFQNGEFMAPAMVDRKVCENINLVHPRFGGTYIDVLLSMPPSWLVHKRPVLPAQWYAQEFFPEDFAMGMGYGFSVIAESILNFHYAGPFIYGFLLGLLFLYIDKRLNKTTSFYFFTVFCLLQYYIFLIPRSGIAGLIKPAAILVLVICGCIFAISYLLRRRSKVDV